MMQEEQLRLPPFNEGSEQSVLGGLLLDNNAYDRIVERVVEADFYVREHRLIFHAMVHLFDRQQPVDVITVAEILDSFKQLDDVGGLSYLAGLAQNTPSSSNIEHYANTVRDHSLMRRMDAISSEISQKIYKRDGVSARELLDFAQSRWMQVGDSLNKAKDTMQHVNDVMANVTDMIDEAFSRDDQDDVTGLRTGILDLDKMTTGMQSGDLIIIAGRPSMGKTSFALNILENVCIYQKKNAAFFSLEMINNQLGIRLLSSVSKLPAQRVRVGRLNDDEWSHLTMGVGKLHDVGMYLDEESNLSVSDIRARSRRLHRHLNGNLDLIIVDYLQLISVAGGDTRANEMADVSRKLKLLAKELQVPVIALSQLNRGLEQRPDKRPKMSDLRDSGGIEQDADTIIFIYRDEVYDIESPDKGTAEIIVGKQRNGPIGTVRTTFVNHLTRFENYSHGNESRNYGDE